MLAHEMTLNQALERFNKVKQRLSEIPEQINRQRSNIADKQQIHGEISIRLAEINACGYESDPNSTHSERNAHHLAAEAKRMKASVTAHKLEVDALQSEQSNLQVVQSQLLRIIQEKQRQAERQAQQVLRNGLDPSVIDKARDAFAECLCYVAISEGSQPSALDRTRVIERYLEKQLDAALTKQTEALYASRKQEALESITQ